VMMQRRLGRPQELRAGAAAAKHRQRSVEQSWTILRRSAGLEAAAEQGVVKTRQDSLLARGTHAPLAMLPEVVDQAPHVRGELRQVGQ